MNSKAAFLIGALTAAPLASQAEEAFVDFRVLTPSIATKLAQATLDHCAAAGYQIGVTVADRFGLPQVFLRDRFAGLHVYETSRRKAFTAVSFRTETSNLAASTQAGQEASSIRNLTEVLALGGGLPIYDGNGALVAGIGVSGAPGPSIDEECALAGLSAIEDDIAF